MVAKRQRREPNDSLRGLAQDYCLIAGFDAPVEDHYVHVDESRAVRIARNYESLPSVSKSIIAKWSYEALALETKRQWEMITIFGHYRLEPWVQDGQPYADSEEMCADLRENRHLYFFTGGEPHPFLGTVDEETGFNANEMLRAVHDVFGHAAEGYGFGPRGEENAWIHHSMMFSPMAQHALTTETRGQNSWVNFGPYSHLPVEDRPYADQKVALLPMWCADWKGALNG